MERIDGAGAEELESSDGGADPRSSLGDLAGAALAEAGELHDSKEKGENDPTWETDWDPQGAK